MFICIMQGAVILGRKRLFLREDIWYGYENNRLLSGHYVSDRTLYYRMLDKKPSFEIITYNGSGQSAWPSASCSTQVCLTAKIFKRIFSYKLGRDCTGIHSTYKILKKALLSESIKSPKNTLSYNLGLHNIGWILYCSIEKRNQCESITL